MSTSLITLIIELFELNNFAAKMGCRSTCGLHWVVCLSTRICLLHVKYTESIKLISTSRVTRIVKLTRNGEGSGHLRTQEFPLCPMQKYGGMLVAGPKRHRRRCLLLRVILRFFFCVPLVIQPCALYCYPVLVVPFVVPGG